jgi:outer membrane protein assembly factor BamB
VVTFGAEGTATCLDLQTGKKLWAISTREQFNTAKGFFGAACSPLVEGNHVLLNVGGAGEAGIVALKLQDGSLAWKATSDEAGYSSPVAADIGGTRHALFFTRNGLVSLNPLDGAIYFSFPWRSRMHASVNAATPLVLDDHIFLSSSYGAGAVLLRVHGRRLEKVWSSDDSLSNHYATSVCSEGFLYGFHGRQEHGPSFRCVDLKSGTVRWSEDSLPAGTVTVAGKRLLLLLEDGRLLLARATPSRLDLQAQSQILPFGVRAYPALSNGRLYARSKDQLGCFDLRASKP